MTTQTTAVKVNAAIGGVQESLTLALGAKAKALKAEGVDLISFTAGEPDFDTPQAIQERAIADIKGGMTRYTPASGLPELKKAICEKLKRENNLEYEPSQILVSCGAKHSLDNVFRTMLEPGDEVLLPTPYWLSYPEQVRMAGGTPVELPTGADANYKITPEQLEAAIGEKTVAIVFNSPSNPTGMVYSPAEVRALAEVLERHPHVTVVADEIYERLIYGDAEHLSMAAVSPEFQARTLLVNGMSKTYAMTGWRIGYCAGPKEFIAAMGRLQSHSTSNPTSFCQTASIAALEKAGDDVEKMRRAFDERRKKLVARLNKIPGVRCPEPLGAFYVFPEVASLYEKAGVAGSLEFCEKLLNEARLVCVPGRPFGDDRSIRMSYAIAPEAIEEGLGRLEKFIEGLSS